MYASKLEGVAQEMTAEVSRWLARPWDNKNKKKKRKGGGVGGLWVRVWVCGCDQEGGGGAGETGYFK